MQRETISFKVADLKPHPRQADNFDDLDDGPFKELVDDIRVNGLNHAIEITPDGVLIDGHQRLRAVKELGWIEVMVDVRHDLADEGEQAIEVRTIEANTNRRQLGVMDRARLYVRLRELTKTSPDTRNGEAGYALRTELKKHFPDNSDRSLRRYERLLQLSRILQREVNRGKLPVVLAERILSANPGIMKKLVAAVTAGEDVRATAKKLLPKTGKESNKGTGIDGAVTAIDTAITTLRQQTKRGGCLEPFHRGRLEKAKAKLQDLLADQRGRSGQLGP